MYNLLTIFTKKDFDHSAIYKMTSPSGKIYIGQCQEIYKRFQEYRRPRATTYLLRAIKKYGLDNINVEFLEIHIPLENLDEREQYYLDTLQPFDDNGYNICRIAGTTRGRKRPQSEMQGIINFNKTKIGELNHFYGKNHSEESKKLISNAKKGKKSTIPSKNCKQVNQICLMTSEILNTFNSITEASNITGINKTVISNVVNKKMINKSTKSYLSKSAGGFYWKFVD